MHVFLVLWYCVRYQFFKCFYFLSWNSSSDVVVLQLIFTYSYNLTKHKPWAKGGSTSLLLNNLFPRLAASGKITKILTWTEWGDFADVAILQPVSVFGNNEVNYIYIIVIHSMFFDSSSFHSQPVNKIHVIKKPSWLDVTYLCKRNTRHMWCSHTNIYTFPSLKLHSWSKGFGILNILSFTNREGLEPYIRGQLQSLSLLFTFQNWATAIIWLSYVYPWRQYFRHNNYFNREFGRSACCRRHFSADCRGTLGQGMEPHKCSNRPQQRASKLSRDVPSLQPRKDKTGWRKKIITFFSYHYCFVLYYDRLSLKKKKKAWESWMEKINHTVHLHLGKCVILLTANNPLFSFSISRASKRFEQFMTVWAINNSDITEPGWQQPVNRQ